MRALVQFVRSRRTAKRISASLPVACADRNRFPKSTNPGFYGIPALVSAPFCQSPIIRDIKEDRELAWVACARDIKNRAR